MKKTYRILLVIFFILILKCITPEDVQADTFTLLDDSYQPITELSLDKGEKKKIIVGIKTGRDNAGIKKVEIPECVETYSINQNSTGKTDVWHSDGSKTSGYDIVMVIWFKGGNVSGDSISQTDTIKVYAHTLKTESKWRPDIGIVSFDTYESVYAEATMQLQVTVTDPFKQIQFDEVNKFEKYCGELVNTLNTNGADGIPALIAAAGSDYYKLALLFGALADSGISYNLEDLYNGMIHHARR